jgi:hypothetical protein
MSMARCPQLGQLHNCRSVETWPLTSPEEFSSSSPSPEIVREEGG